VTSNENGLPETATPFSWMETVYRPDDVTSASIDDCLTAKDVAGSCKMEADIADIEQPDTAKRRRPPFG
jgi:hypothetical protein